MMNERQQLERSARWSYEQLMAALNEAEYAAEKHIDLLDELLPPGHSSIYVIDELLVSIRDAKRAMGDINAR